MSKGPTVCLLAADVSGDRLAANLADELRQRVRDIRLIGAGGPAMAQAGVDLSVQLTQLSFTGVLDALQVSRELARSVRAVQRMVLQHRPDLVVLVDAEVVSLPFAAWLRRRGIPAAFYFPPQTWLWGRWRMPFVVPLVRRVLSAFRDEAELYRQAGADTVWTGHPLADVVQVREDPIAALTSIGLDPNRPLVVLMPGSRRSEIQRLGPPILGAAQRLQTRDPRLQFALPLASASLHADVTRVLARHPVRDLVVYRPDTYAVLSQARAVIQSSGTATLETALLGIPSVITYRLRPIEYAFARAFMHVDYIGMVNILLGEMVQPELFQKGVDPEHLADAAWALLTDEVRRRTIIRRLTEIREVLGAPGAIARAATALIELLPATAVQEEIGPRRAAGASASV